jgi:hypothetical protein
MRQQSCYASDYGVHGTGLGLYESSSHGERGYDVVLLDAFFAYLSSAWVSRNMVSQAICFLNVHLKSEFYCRMLRETGSATVCQISVGTMPSAKAARKAAAQNVAARAEEELEDIQADLHNSISDDSIGEIAECILCAPQNSYLGKMDTLRKILLAA